MTPPGATGSAKNAGTLSPPAALSRLDILKRRTDFLRAARAKRQAMPGFILQARRRGSDEAPPDRIRVGVTCSKKVGNAVARNRAKRRLRELARRVLPQHARPGWDYVLVGRRETTETLVFADLLDDLRAALRHIHGE